MYTNMNIHRLIVFLSLTVGLTVFAVAEATVGTINFMEGTVEVTRNGEFIAPHDIGIGFTLQMFDTINTGDDGYVEVLMTAPASGSFIKVNSGTAFYFEGTSKKSSSLRTIFQLLRGALRIKVGKLAPQETYSIQTDNATMAVRGTEFTVDMAQDRSVLITASEGKVGVRSHLQTRTVEPGVVAQIDENAKVTISDVQTKEISQYREKWLETRLEALQINATLSIQHHAISWDRLFPKLEVAMRELASHEDVFQRWDAIANGQRKKPSTGEVISDKRVISRGMLALRATLPETERIFFTLLGLENVYRDGYASGSFKKGNSSNATEFYQSFNKDKVKIRKMLSKARSMVRIFRVLDSSIGGLTNSGSGIMDTIPNL